MAGNYSLCVVLQGQRPYGIWKGAGGCFGVCLANSLAKHRGGPDGPISNVHLLPSSLILLPAALPP